MSTHNEGFYGKLFKIISQLSSNIINRYSEFRFLASPDRFRNCQTVLFYEKRIFIGPKNVTFYLFN